MVDGECGFDVTFDTVLREAAARLSQAHAAELGTLQAELQRMRRENTAFRMRLAEMGNSVACDTIDSSMLNRTASSEVKHHNLTSDPDLQELSRHYPKDGSASQERGPRDRPVTVPDSVDATMIENEYAASTCTAPSQLEPKDEEQKCTGMSGRVRQISPDVKHSSQRQPVAPELRLPPRPTTERARGAEACLCPGRTVRIRGLRHSQSLNGTEGICSHFDAASGRWIVRIHPDVEKAFRPDNLEEIETLSSQDTMSHTANTSDSVLSSHASSTRAAVSEENTSSTGQPISVASAAVPEANSAVSDTTSHKMKHIEEPEVIEIKTEGVTADDGGGEVDPMEKETSAALNAALERLGLQDVHVQNSGRGNYIICGVPVMLCTIKLSDRTQCELRASTDGGRTWEGFEHVYRRHAGIDSSQSSPHGTNRPHVRPAPQAQVPRQHNSGLRGNSAAGTVPPRQPTTTTFGHSGNPTCTGTNLHPVQGQRTDGLPSFNNAGLPSFNNAFPPAFTADGGSTQYYSNFRVRVPMNSQYD